MTHWSVMVYARRRLPHFHEWQTQAEIDHDGKCALCVVDELESVLKGLHEGEGGPEIADEIRITLSRDGDD